MEDFGASEVQEAGEELRKALGVDHPLGLAAPQLGKGLRMVVIGETEDTMERLTTRAQITEEHRAFKATVLINPVVTPKPGALKGWADVAPSRYSGLLLRAVRMPCMQQVALCGSKGPSG